MLRIIKITLFKFRIEFQIKSHENMVVYKLQLKNTTIDKTLTYASETWTLTKTDRKQLNIFERKVYSRILGPVYGNQKR